jgi:hypothetical protein
MAERLPRGVLTVAHLRARCCVDSLSGCWLWQYGCSSDGVPRIHTLDYERGDKRVMSGPKAAWNIAHGAAPRRGALVFRRCQQARCLNPVHLALAESKAAIGLHIRRAGTRKGTAVESRRRNAQRGRAQRGIVSTPNAAVMAITLAPPEMPSGVLAERFGLKASVVSRIRRFETRRAF